MTVKLRGTAAGIYRLRKVWTQEYVPIKDSLTPMQKRKYLRHFINKITAKYDLEELERIIEQLIDTKIEETFVTEDEEEESETDEETKS